MVSSSALPERLPVVVTQEDKKVPVVKARSVEARVEAETVPTVSVAEPSERY